MSNEIDIKCPCCGKIFQVAKEAYLANEDIVCPPCDIVIKPQGNKLNDKARVQVS